MSHFLLQRDHHANVGAGLHSYAKSLAQMHVRQDALYTVCVSHSADETRTPEKKSVHHTRRK